MSPSSPVPMISGIHPNLCLSTELGPPRTEIAPGAMFAWAERLWVVTYVSSGKSSGVGGGLYEIFPDMTMVRRPESVTGTYTGRMAHWESNQLLIGPYAIDAKRNVRFIESVSDIRLAAFMRHLDDPENMVYVLGMEGEFYELNVHTLEAKFLENLCGPLGIPEGHWPHFKAGYTAFGKVVIANNTYDIEDFNGTKSGGCLAEWDGNNWTILDNAPYYEVTGLGTTTKTMFATGWDKASALLQFYNHYTKKWTRYRIPKSSHTYDHGWSTEWPRIRQTEHERLLMDCHGTFFELSPWAFGDAVFGLRPISTHLWVLGDFCSWRGMLVLGADNASAWGPNNILAGEPQSGMWFGKTDDLWNFGKPSGLGGPWWKNEVHAGEASDPYLMTGYDQKCLHLSQQGGGNTKVALEVDFLGTGDWQPYLEIELSADGYAHHEFPTGFSAHWVRLIPQNDATLSAQFMYT